MLYIICIYIGLKIKGEQNQLCEAMTDLTFLDLNKLFWTKKLLKNLDFKVIVF